jgi:proteasome accessory factor C
VIAPRAPRPAPESATARLSRLLTMVPWLLARQGVDIDVAAAQFHVTREQLESDLQLLFVCGTPGHLPDDLIEADWEDGQVYIGNADAISRPLRFTVDEALTLMVGLRALAATPGVTGAAGGAGGEAILRALAKLEEATGEAAGVASRMRVTLDDGAAESILADASRAVQNHRRVRLRYQSFGRDEVTERDVDPMRVTSLDAHWYLEGWCHRAEDTRLFRLDRVQSLDVLEVDGTPPGGAQPRDLAGQTYQPSPDDEFVELVTEPGGAWVADYYPVEAVVDLGDGRRQIRLRAADTTWLRRLAWRLGGQVHIIAPATLAADVARGADAALAAYPPEVLRGLGGDGMPPTPVSDPAQIPGGAP